MKLGSALSLALLSVLTGALCSYGQLVVYDNLGTSAIAGTSKPNSENPIFGDSLNLAQGGTLTSIGLSVYNSSSGGNTGSMLAGTMLIRFYDNTTPYSGGVLNNPLLGSATVTWDFGSGGLPVGYYITDNFDISALNITVPEHILITQQFTETSGTSLRNGVILFGDPTVGSSPNTVYLNSTSTAEGLYTFSNNPGQFGYTVEVAVPEPTTMALGGLAFAAVLSLRRRG